MNDPLDALLSMLGDQNLYPSNSRYHGIARAVLELPDGRPVGYLRRRFLPPAGRLPLLVEHAVSQGDRLDNLAAQYLGDPELAWRICDANNVMHPREAANRPGESLRITLPDGTPGSQNA